MNGHPNLLRLDEVTEAGRREALEHVRGCAACRRAVVAGDPTRVFTLLAVRPVPRDVLDRVSIGVAAAVRGGGSVPSRLPSARRTRIAAAWAAAALAVVLLLPLGGGSPGSVPKGETAVLAPPEIPRAGVEVVSPPGQPQVVDLTVGETQLVMIFDPRIDL
jgi:hypothetical protein